MATSKTKKSIGEKLVDGVEKILDEVGITHPAPQVEKKQVETQTKDQASDSGPMTLMKLQKFQRG